MYYHAIPQSDTYKELFKSAILIIGEFHKNDPYSRVISVDKICTCYESSRSLLETAVYLMLDGVDESVFEFIMELKANAYLSESSISESEKFEILLTKMLIKYIRQGDHGSILSLLNYICTSETRNEISPPLLKIIHKLI